MIKIEIKSYFGSVLFEYEKENNTLLETVNAAVAAGANLRGADLGGANLGGANLRGADLGGANLGDADLSTIKNDFFEILLKSKKEIPGLRQSLVDGKINGSTYEGECACLVGTIANVRGCSHNKLQGIIPDGSRPAERWFLHIKEGITPENNQVAKITLDWIDEFTTFLNN